jgi:hypothetical protein
VAYTPKFSRCQQKLVNKEMSTTHYGIDARDGSEKNKKDKVKNNMKK